MGRTHHEIGHRLTALVAQIHALDVRAHPLQDDEETGARRIDADVLDEELTFLREHRRSDEKRSARRVAGDGQVKGRYGGWAVRRFENDRTFPLVNPKAQMREESLGVIPRAIGFVNRHGHVASEPREQDRTLHLRACHGTLVGEPAQSAAADCERQSIASLSDLGSHLP